MPPKVSVIIPVYNIEAYLRECLESVCNQTLDSIQIIVVDDGSTDGSAAICREFADRFPEKVEYYYKENGGSASARNMGLDHAVGDYVGFIDSDDWVEPDMYEKMYEKMVQYDCDIVFCRNFRSSEYTSGGEIKRCNSEDCIYSIISEEERKAFIVNNIIGYVCGKRLF